MLLLGLASALALGVLSLVRVAPDSGPGTAEAEPRHPSTLTAEPSAGVSATVVAVPSAAKAPVSASPSTRPTPSTASSSPSLEASPAPTARPSETPRTAVQQTPAPPEAAPTPAPTPTPTPTPSTTPPPPDDKGLCVPVLGVCLKLR
ncbi:hypothetical protein E5083_02180 [Streptomyces bauhiniae]|uniref:Uncharacterized protein n=1 Tax=Streptomyces bauhiniae TaxID=2340725 RepID=A0A4Z1DH42_9ACTN|nr:hypothetical protein E5083_02180 [Streptomyces bauhiniae]